MKKIYVIVKTVIDNKTKEVKEISVDYGFESIERAKEYLKSFTNSNPEYAINASNKILMWKGMINTYTREIKETEIWR